MQEEATGVEYPRIYRMRAGWRIAGVSFGILFTLAGLAVAGAGAWFGLDKLDDYLVFGFLFLMFLVLGVASILGALRTHIVLERDAIEMRGVVIRRRLARADISHRQMINHGKGGDVLHLVPIHADSKPVKIFHYMESDATLQAWLGAIKDLDAEERRASEEALFADPELGFTREEREQRVVRARKVAKALEWTTYGVAVWAFAYPVPYELAILALAILPWLAVAIAAGSKGLYRLDGKRNDANPALTTVVLVPSIVLAARAFLDVKVLDWQQALLLAAIGGAVAAIVIGVLLTEVREKPASLVLMGVFMICHVYGAAVLANSYFDDSPRQRHEVRVYDKRISNGRNKAYYLRLEAWGPTSPGEVSVPRELYDRISRNDSICVYEWAGAIGIAWYSVELCDQPTPEKQLVPD